MSNKIKFKAGDVDDFYEPSDSDGEYTEREKKLLKKARNIGKRNDEVEKEVLAFDDDEDDYDAFQENSDFEEEADANDGIPDERAWGKKRRDFYSTDFVDQDYSSYNVNEEHAAEQEEEEARAIQQRLAKQLEEADFTLDVFSSGRKSTKGGAQSEERESSIHLKSDLSDLSQRQKLQMFRKDSPEFEGLVADFEQRILESQQILDPVLEYFRKNQHLVLPIADFVRTKNELSLTYCSNVAFYLVLKAKRIPIKNHPLVKRLVQLRQLLLQIETKYETVVKPQLEKLLAAIASGNEFEIRANTPSVPLPIKPKKSKLNIVKAFDNEPDEEPMDDTDNTDEDENPISSKEAPTQSDSDEEEQLDEAEEMGDDEERRQITYQMSKNKGLTPHRKKELRNPRVKHRNKFRKALIRRKGAVRTVRKESKRYGGEVSGIKASTKKGIKIK